MLGATEVFLANFLLLLIPIALAAPGTRTDIYARDTYRWAAVGDSWGAGAAVRKTDQYVYSKSLCNQISTSHEL